MTSTLSTAGISYELQNNGTAIAVQSNQTARARVALAGAGELGNSQPDFSLFEKQNLGESNFQQQVTYQRALQGQLAETIDSVQGVSGAQVELVIPSAQNQVFGESSSAASAAVLLSGTTSLDPASVKGIAQLVASSVPGSAAQQSHDHRRLRPAALAGGGRGRRQLGLQRPGSRAALRPGTAASLDAMLAQTLGAGQGPGARLREHERQPDDAGIAGLRQGRRAAAAEQEHRDAHRRRRGHHRHDRAPRP